MQDIGRRIRRYRLTRYATPTGGFPHPPRWIWLALALWLAWVGFVSDHSLYRIWRVGAEGARTRRQLAEMRSETARLDAEARDPAQRTRQVEGALRKEGFARKGEIIYRIQPRPDTTQSRP
jgi:hypothetical protein